MTNRPAMDPVASRLVRRASRLAVGRLEPRSLSRRQGGSPSRLFHEAATLGDDDEVVLRLEASQLCVGRAGPLFERMNGMVSRRTQGRGEGPRQAFVDQEPQ